MTEEVEIEEPNVSFVKGKMVQVGSLKMSDPVPGDYVILLEQFGKNKKLLAQVKKTKGGILHVVLEATRHLDDVVETKFPYSHLIFNFGQDLSSFEGQTFMGVKVEKLHKTKKTPLGNIHYFRDLPERDDKLLMKALKRTKKTLDAWKLQNLYPVEFHIKRKKGKYDGFYKVTKGEDLNIITLQPEEYTPGALMHILIHEFGHGVHAYNLGPKEIADWIKLYHRFVEVKRDDEYINDILNDFLAQGDNYDPPNDMYEQIFEEAVAYIEEKHLVRYKDLKALLEAGEQELVKEMWPDWTDISEQETAVTEYAKENPVEFFCESFAYYNMSENSRDKLPKAVRQRMENTLKLISR